MLLCGIYLSLIEQIFWMINMPTSFGQKLKDLRHKQDKSQEDVVNEIKSMFGDKIRMSQTTLSALEQRDSAPKEDVLEVLAEYYNVPITFFFDAEHPNVDVKSYIDALRLYNPQDSRRFAHSSKHRQDGDEVEQSLDDEYFLDSD